MRKKITAAVVGIAVIAGSFGAGYLTRDRRLLIHSSSSDYTSLQDLSDTLHAKFDGTIDDTKLLDSAKAGLIATANDPYTVYLSKAEAQALSDQLTGTFSGVGAEVGIRSGKLVIISPLVDSPAAKAGLRAGDQILKINGEDPSALTLDEAVGKIKGPEGSEVTLNLARGNGAPFDVKITRAVINQPSVKSSMKGDSVGYIQIVRFGEDTVSLFKTQAKALQAQGAKKFIIDLRNDPGGYLQSAVDIGGQLVDSKVIVEERKGSTSIDKLSSQSGGLLLGVPTVVLINGGSASASEIVAGALQDYKAATIVGEKSFGKGSVQEIISLADGAELKVTVAHWYTPNGKNITKEGIVPDVEVKLEQADFDAGRDPQLDKAIDLLK